MLSDEWWFASFNLQIPIRIIILLRWSEMGKNVYNIGERPCEFDPDPGKPGNVFFQWNERPKNEDGLYNNRFLSIMFTSISLFATKNPPKPFII